MKKYIQYELEKIADRHDLPTSSAKAHLLLAFRVLQLGANFLLTRFYLRNCQLNGRLIFTRNRPTIANEGGEIEIGNLVRIWSNVNRTRLSVKKGGRIVIGENTRINGATIAASSEVNIGRNCRIAPHCIVMDGDFHDVSDRLKAGRKASINIGDNAWLATRSMVMKGVTIGEGAVVAAGAVVTKDVPPYTMVAGVPAKVVKRIPQPGQVQKNIEPTEQMLVATA